MLVEMTMYPLGETHVGKDLAEIMKTVNDSSLPYRLTPTGTCIEGEWDEVMALVKRCHQQMRRHSSHVVTSVTIEDEEGATNKLRENVASVEQKVAFSIPR